MDIREGTYRDVVHLGVDVHHAYGVRYEFGVHHWYGVHHEYGVYYVGKWSKKDKHWKRRRLRKS